MMAQVLAPIQPSGSMTMLHSPQDVFAAGSAGQPHHPQSRSAQIPRNHIYSQVGSIGYRGASSAPVAPYAFQSTPNLRLDVNKSLPLEPSGQPVAGKRPTPLPSGRSALPASSAGLGGDFLSKDDSAISRVARRHSDFSERATSSIDLSSTTASSSSPEFVAVPDGQQRQGPERYRHRRSEANLRPGKGSETARSASPAGSAKHIVDTVGKRPPVVHKRTGSADDGQVVRVGTADLAKRYRRRSVGSFENLVPSAKEGLPVQHSGSAAAAAAPPKSDAGTTLAHNRPIHASHRRSASGESNSSHAGQRSSSSRRSSQTATPPGSPSLAHDQRQPHIAPRGLPEYSKRISSPSPLSRPVNADASDAPTTDAAKKASMFPQPSPAVQQLAALSGQSGGRGVKSRLRRALSFSSSAELRKASAQNNMSKSRQEIEDPLDPEQRAIADKQEAAGFGSGIYSGQGGFTSSTDNLSISSTASSASIMLRKMGKSMKKSSRSLKGLFRPKSVIGVPAVDNDGSMPVTTEVSMITVEAERERNRATVPARAENYASQPAKASHLDRPETPVGGSSTSSRRSIVGCEVERAEVLAAVKKGILKNSGSSSANSSPAITPADAGRNDMSLPNIPQVASNFQLGSPDMPENVSKVGIVDDYFIAVPQYSSGTGSQPGTPQGGARNISFSPRIQFYDALSSVDYDRRGDVATCNRLTPMLAQQIKEELNTFKMEMEVHESSKPHTHFF